MGKNYYDFNRRKHFVFFFIIFISHLSFAQAPDGYYEGLESLDGDLLKLGLHNLVKDHIEYRYTSSSTDVWDILKETDQDPNNPENVILFYTGWSINGDAEYNRGQGWTREHVWAKSHGDFGIDPGAGTDVHALRPADVTVNSARNNKDFDEGGEFYIDGNGPTENRIDSDSWEPRDKVKGDVARCLFYMAVRYEGGGDEPDLELVDSVRSVDSNAELKGYHGKLSMLLKWHFQDPVDESELSRNDVVFFYQGNRNPFIDHPEWVTRIWDSSGVGFFEPFEAPESETPDDITDTLNIDSILFVYYKDLENLEGESLKNTLSERIEEQQSYSYTSNSQVDVWDILKETDKDTANPENVLLFYTGRSVNAAQEFNSGRGWTREHIWPVSHGGFDLTRGIGTDVHNIRPADNTVARARGDLDFDKGGEIYVDEADTTGNRVDADSWEPRDEVKGDVARMLFYMATHYEGLDDEPDLELLDSVNTVEASLNGLGFHGKVSTLLQWHKADPVDQYERRRNNVIYIFQGNRNPFIDHPEYANRIWDPLLYDTTVVNYYAELDTLLDHESFKSALHALVDSQTIYNYTDNDEVDVWDILKQSDRDPNDSSNVLLFYTGWSVDAEQEFNNGRGWSREDIWSLAHGDLSSYRGVGTDVHAIRPADITVNRARGDRDFDEGGTLYLDGDGDTGAFRDEDSWEPRDEVKGDVARMLFYMAVRYEGGANEPDLELLDTVLTENFTQPGLGYHGKFSTLLKWHEADPVGRFERLRNQSIFEFQGNRNPFIDNPSYVYKVWDTTQALVFIPDTTEVLTSTLETLEGQNTLFLYPNPAKEQVILTATHQQGGFESQVRILSLEGKVLKEFSLLPNKEKAIDLSSLANGVYLVAQGNSVVKLFIQR